jgi:hypothetical protein
MLEPITHQPSPSLHDALDALARSVQDVQHAAHTSSSAGALLATLRLADRMHALAVGMLRAMAASGDVERETGLPIEMALRLEGRRAHWDARELITAAEQLARMPETGSALSDGTLSWSQARAIVRSVKDLDATARATVDRVVGSNAGALADAEPEAILDRIEDAAARLRPDRTLRSEDRAIERRFLALQPMLGGGGTLYGEADAESFATIASALDAAAERAVADEGDGRTRARARMDGLVALCEDRLAGGGVGAARTRPRPRVLATIDLDETGHHLGARLLASVCGRAPRLSTLATETLLCDADVVPIVFDGARPLAVGDTATPISSKMRTAIIARDRGCRFPSCGAPASWSDVHHVIPGGPSVEANLVLLCRRCHRRVHRSRWRIRLRDDRSIEFRYRGRTYVSPPRARSVRTE